MNLQCTENRVKLNHCNTVFLGILYLRLLEWINDQKLDGALAIDDSILYLSLTFIFETFV